MKKSFYMLMIITISLSGCISTQNKKSSEAFHVNPIVGLSRDFMKGVDISTLYELEENGRVFYNKKGKQEDLFVILKDHGVNWVRLRVWNDPYDIYWSEEATGGTIVTGPIGGGTNDMKKTISMAKRAKDAGFKILIDFHYSDFWADPGKQVKPKAWLNLHGEDLQNALYDFTKESLADLVAAGAEPDMVQVGNEINNGMVHDDGRGVISEGCINLLKSGTKAVREINKDIKIMIHLAEGGDKDLFQTVFDAYTEANLDYDVVGASYYPFWHGSFTDLQENLDNVASRYNKEVVVVETSYGYTFDNYDEQPNIFNKTLAKKGGYEATPQGQATFVRDVMQVVNDVPGGLGTGIFYWEPAWLSTPGTGWIATADNGWENQAMFDKDGRPLKSLNVFNLVDDKKNRYIKPEVIGLEDTDIIEYPVGEPLNLPQKVEAIFSDGSKSDIDVVWEDFDIEDISSTGFTVKGIAGGYDVYQIFSVIAASKNNLLLNSGFETGDFSNWVLKSDTGTESSAAIKKHNNALDSKYAINYWLDSNFSWTLEQRVEGLTEGLYTVTVPFIAESTGNSNSYMYVISGEKEYKLPLVGLAWNDGIYTEYKLENIELNSGDVIFGLVIDEAANSWGWIDGIKFESVK